MELMGTLGERPVEVKLTLTTEGSGKKGTAPDSRQRRAGGGGGERLLKGPPRRDWCDRRSRTARAGRPAIGGAGRDRGWGLGKQQDSEGRKGMGTPEEVV